MTSIFSQLDINPKKRVSVETPLECLVFHVYLENYTQK